MFPAVNTVYRRYFPENPPARIFINVPAWNGGFDIEVDCIAVGFIRLQMPLNGSAAAEAQTPHCRKHVRSRFMQVTFP